MFNYDWHNGKRIQEIEYEYRRDIVKFMEDQYYVPDIGKTVTLAEAQKTFIRRAVNKTDGVIDYNVVAYTALKKSFKTGMTGARAIWTCLEPNKKVFFIARSREQAQDRAFTMVTDSLTKNPYPALDGPIKTTEVNFKNGSSIKCLPCTLAVAGINYDLVCLTEGWSWTEKRHFTVFAEVAVPPARADVAAIHIDSYAGHTDIPSVVSNLWTDVVKDREPIEDKRYPGVFYERNKILYIEDQVPRLTHQTPSYYATQKLVLLPADYARQCENRHVHSTYVGDDAEVFSTVNNDDVESLKNNDDWTFHAALDMAMESDLASVCVIAYNAEAEKAVEVETVAFHPPISFVTVEGEIERMRKEYEFNELGLDIWQTGYLSQKWEWTRPVSQQTERRAGDTLTYNWIRQKNLSLIKGGNVAKAYESAAKKSVGNNQIRFIKSHQSTSKIDPLVACSMALFCAVYPDKRNKKKPFEEGEISRRGIPRSGNIYDPLAKANAQRADHKKRNKQVAKMKRKKKKSK